MNATSQKNKKAVKLLKLNGFQVGAGAALTFILKTRMNPRG